MRRMISFTPVAKGTVNLTENRFDLDNKLEKGFYLIVMEEPTYQQSCSCFLKITDNTYCNSTVFIPAVDSDGQSTILSFASGQPNMLSIGIPDLFPAGSTLEVIRIA